MNAKLRNCEIAKLPDAENCTSRNEFEFPNSTNPAFTHFRNSAMLSVVDVDKIGSVTSPLGLAKTVGFVSSSSSPRAGDVVVVRALTDSATYNMLELPTGRLAKINRATC